MKESRCPSLALLDEGEEPQRQSDAFCQGVGGQIDTCRFTTTQGADSHCHVGNLSYSSGIILDWLDKRFR